MNDLIKRISDAKEMIERRPNQSTVDYTIYGVLTDSDIMLKSQQERIEKMRSLLSEADEEIERLKEEIELLKAQNRPGFGG